ncbi:hypothetical protein AAIG85_35850, partial [Pseudomonas aeruginosa]|uniref:hypothetical protein n=1 Tax=Pseudomonas aeruginosa TaxID=287 RepID=UPI0031B6DA3D
MGYDFAAFPESAKERDIRSRGRGLRTRDGLSLPPHLSFRLLDSRNSWGSGFRASGYCRRLRSRGFLVRSRLR